MSAGSDGKDEGPLVSTTVDQDQNVSMAVLRAVAALDDEPIDELPQLYRTVDPDALCELAEDDRFDGAVEFGFDNYVVRIDGGLEIEIYDGNGSA